MSDGSLKVPKQTIAVQVRLLHSAEWSGEIFLSYCSPIHEGPQGLLEFLNEPASFFPIRFDRGEIRLVGKSDVVAVTATLDTLRESSLGTEFTVSARGRFFLNDDTTLDGLVDLTDCEVTKPRLVDALNHESSFLAMISDDTFHAVNKCAVRWVVPIESSRDGLISASSQEGTHV